MPSTSTQPNTQHGQELDMDPWQDCRCSEPVRACLGNTFFLIITFLLISDIFSDIWVTIILALHGEMVLAGICVLSLVTTSIILAFMYAVQIKYDGSSSEQPFYHLPGCLLLNVPLQLGIIGHRMKHFCQRSKQCCTILDQRNSREWTFAKLKLAQCIFQSAPMLIVNIYAMLVHWNTHGVDIIQYISATNSFLSLITGAVNHEKVRKERVRNVQVGIAQITCIFIYKTLMLVARVMALVNFLYFYHGFIVAILLPHFFIVFVFFSYVYRAVWKVRYYKIFMHALYCILAYFPIHNDYRPEGEILMYYTLFIIENIIMVSVPYALKTMTPRPQVHLPGSQYYYVITICVLVGSAVGLCFMAIYYFLLHRSKATIQEQHLNWLSRFCIWSNKEEDAPTRPMTSQASPDGSRLHVSQEVDGGGMRNGVLDENVEHEHLLTVVTELEESCTPPTYRASLTCPHHGNINANNASVTDSTDSRVNNGAEFSPKTVPSKDDSDCGLNNVKEENHYDAHGNSVRSSVLSGDDDLRDYDSDQDQDTQPLHVIV